jgi:hypothetical protein
MKHLASTGVLVAILALCTAAPAFPHHSHAMFDLSNELTITGTVTAVVFRNPHAFLYVDVKKDDGQTVNYSIEMSNLPNMIRRGVTPSTFKVGDKVTANVNPLKDGRPGGSYVTIVAADGKRYE